MQNMREQTDQMSDLDNQWLIAKVAENVDPSGQHRIKITIPSIPSLSQTPVWAAPDHVNGGGGGGDATQDIPAVGSQVYVKLQGGDAHFPLYRGGVVGPGVLNTLTHGGNGNPNVYGWKRGSVQFTADKSSGEIYLLCPNFTLHIDPGGNVTVQGAGSLNAQFSSATFNIPNTLFTGNVVVQQALTANGMMTANGGFGAANGMPCTLPTTTTIGGITVYTHTHGGVQRGGELTNPMSG